MMPHVCAEGYQPFATKETAMLANTGKRLTTRITEHVQEKLQAAADLGGATHFLKMALMLQSFVISRELRLIF